ncbi:MAG: NUDIX domain-containing protein [Zetaproteobacteria bacterium]|nr:NUDIX domain-containing protein [Zetaproteobacteria bacterium]
MPSIAPKPCHDIALVAAINADQQLLLLKRAEQQHCGALWSLPGGKVEKEEPPLTAAQRELLEETGLQSNDWHHLGEQRYDYQDRTLHFHIYRCQINSDQRAPHHCTEQPAWVSIEQLIHHPMPEANQTMMPLILPFLTSQGLA